MSNLCKNLKKYCINVVYKRNTTSTLDVGRKLVWKGCDCPALVVAKTQSKGRGRKNRVFLSKNGGIYMTVVIKSPPFNLLDLVTPAAAVSVVDSIRKVCGIDTKIKWVNDIFKGNKKLCGILTENVADKSGERYIIIGIGVNLVAPKNGFGEELQDVATSLYDFEPEKIREELIKSIYGNVVRLCSNPINIAKLYRSELFIIGKTVVLENGREAIVKDIDENCGLIVAYLDGREEILKTGEVSVKVKDLN